MRNAKGIILSRGLNLSNKPMPRWIGGLSVSSGQILELWRAIKAKSLVSKIWHRAARGNLDKNGSKRQEATIVAHSVTGLSAGTRKARLNSSWRSCKRKS